MFQVLIRNKILLKNAPPEVVKSVKKSLTIRNPLYYKMLMMGNLKALYNVSEFFRYYHEVGEYLFIGRGMEQRLFDYLDRNNIPYEKEYQTVDERQTVPLIGEINLREYQRGDIESIQAGGKNGVIRLGTGYGKTVIACKLTQTLGVTTLIIVPRTHLIDQFRKEFKRFFKRDVGVIQGNTCDVQEITVASIQTLVRRPQLASQLSDKFGMVIVDECHTSITDKQLTVIQTFCPKYLYGMTATARRTDKQGEAIFFTFGDIIIDKDLERAKPHVQMIPYYGHIVLNDYAIMINEQINDDKRNNLIINCITNELKTGRKILVLTKRVAHYSLIGTALRKLLPQPRIHEISSGTNTGDRSLLLETLRSGHKDWDVILGTYSLLSTGTNIEALDTLIFAGDLRSDVLQEQSVGRILRLFEGKQQPKIIDIADHSNKVFINQARERSRFYLKQGWLI